MVLIFNWKKERNEFHFSIVKDMEVLWEGLLIVERRVLGLLAPEYMRCGLCRLGGGLLNQFSCRFFPVEIFGIS